MLTAKDFVSMNDLSAEQILEFLDTAETMKTLLNSNTKKSPHLLGKTAILFFTNRQSRIKLSYELAAQKLSASVADLSGSSGINQNESIVQIGRTMEQMGADFIVVRHPLTGSAKYLAENVSARVINVGDGNNESPTRALLDLMTIKTYKGGFNNLKVTIIGDIDNNRLTTSNMIALIKLGANVTVYGPPTLCNKSIETLGVKVCSTPFEAADKADVIICSKLSKEENYSKVIPSLNEYKNLFKIDEKMISNAAPDVIVLHPGPINRGIEISSGVIDSKYCVMDDQISNSVASNMAQFYLLSLIGGRRR